MDNIKRNYSLAELYRDYKEEKIILPTIQRGFVWKPYQIENLWDSLLRGYPIGAFVVTPKSNGSLNLELLDGQQRATAICLGFYNPLTDEKDDKSKASNDKSNKENSVFKASNDNIMIFVDLNKNQQKKTDYKKYQIRVITKSHPWGYDNQKTLDSKTVSRALEHYFEDEPNFFEFKYLKEPLKKFWPFPVTGTNQYKTGAVPIGIFINAALEDKSIQALKTDIKKWQEKAFNYKACNRDEMNSIEELYEDVKQMLKNQSIPLSNLKVDKLLDNQNQELSDNINEDKLDDVENLFIRLNSGGTPLSGEELNYSILKTRISTKTQDHLEGACEGVMKPSRFVTFLFLLYKDKKNEPSISLRISPTQFQKGIDNHGDFEKFINIFIDSGCIKEVIRILSYKEGNDCGLPSFVYRQLSVKAPEVMFALIYRLYVKKDSIDDDIRPLVLGVITIFSWLGKGETQKDHSKLLNNIWFGVKTFSTKRFWSSEIVQRGMLIYQDRYIIPPIPEIDELKPTLSVTNKITNYSYYKIVYESNYQLFIEKIFFNKDLVLFAQRQALKNWYKDIENEKIDDSNIPFDWDHISPQNLIYNQRGIRDELKDWYNSIGNFRAWPYSLNRSDSDTNPNAKFNPDDRAKWVKSYLEKNEISYSDLNKKLLADSFCEKEWCDLDYYQNSKTIKKKQTIANNDNAKSVLKQILRRNFLLCKHWYDKLCIEELIPEFRLDEVEKEYISELFNEKMNLRNWKADEEDSDELFSKHFKIKDETYLYIQVPVVEPLKEDAVRFGLKNGEEGFESIKINDNKNYIRTLRDDYDLIERDFTLSTLSGESISELFNDFEKWLEGLPKGLDKTLIIEKFHNGLKK